MSGGLPPDVCCADGPWCDHMQPEGWRDEMAEAQERDAERDERTVSTAERAHVPGSDETPGYPARDYSASQRPAGA